MPLVGSFGDGDKARGREDDSGIADVEADPILDDPGLFEIVCCAEIRALIAVNILGSVVAVAEGDDEVFSRKQFVVYEGIRPESRPEKSAYAGAERERSVPIGVEVVGVPGGQVDAAVAEFVLAVYFAAPDVVAFGENAASVTAAPIAEAI